MPLPIGHGHLISSHAGRNRTPKICTRLCLSRRDKATRHANEASKQSKQSKQTKPRAAERPRMHARCPWHAPRRLVTHIWHGMRHCRARARALRAAGGARAFGRPAFAVRARGRGRRGGGGGGRTCALLGGRPRRAVHRQRDDRPPTAAAARVRVGAGSARGAAGTRTDVCSGFTSPWSRA